MMDKVGLIVVAALLLVTLGLSLRLASVEKARRMAVEELAERKAAEARAPLEARVKDWVEKVREARSIHEDAYRAYCGAGGCK